MQTNFSKYLTIPLIASFLFMAIITLSFLYGVYTTNHTYELRYGYFIAAYTAKLAPLPIIFTLTLIFSIAYQLVQPNLKNISYAILVVLAVIIVNQITSLIIDYIYQNYRSPNVYSILYLYSYLNYFLLILMLTGISYLYAKFRNLSLIPLDKKPICVLYACLFISYSMATIMHQMVIAYFEHTLNIYTISLSIISLIIYFSYCYFFADTLLHSSKELTNYPYKMIFSYLLASLLFVIISFFVGAAFMLLAYLFSPPDDLAILLLILGTIFSYIFGIILCFVLLDISYSPIYRRIHWALYIILAITVIAINIVNMHYKLNIILLIASIISSYGFVIFFISLSLYIFYKSNQIATDSRFKYSEPQSVQEV